MYLVPQVHADGEIWAQTMWQLRQVLIAGLGVTTGTDHVRRLLTNAMRLVPDHPTFLDLRNGVLQAAVVSHPADVEDVWAVFAERGMGYFASTTGASDTHPIGDTTAPPAGGGPAGTLSGTVTDAGTGAPIQGLRVAFTGHDTGIGPDLSATTNASGAYAIADVPAGTYPLLRVRGSGYRGRAANVTVGAAPAITTRNFALERNLASAEAGAAIASFTGPDLTPLACGPGALIDQDGGFVWASATFGAPPSIVVDLAARANLTRVELDPTNGCNHDEHASLGEYEVQASVDGTAYVPVASGTFTPGDRGRDNPVALTSPPAGTRFVRLIAKTPQSFTGSGMFFIDVAELKAFGTPYVPTRRHLRRHRRHRRRRRRHRPSAATTAAAAATAARRHRRRRHRHLRRHRRRPAATAAAARRGDAAGRAGRHLATAGRAVPGC